MKPRASRRFRAAGTAVLASVALLLSACSSSGPRPGAGARAEPPATPTARRGGGYYLDDGPGAGPPPDIAAIPDAVPRAEPLLARANRPYTIFDRRYVPMTELAPYRERGVGSWYGRKYHGQRTSSGEVYDMYAMTAAHPTLPLPSYARVTSVRTGRSVVVRINDRGPFLYDRIIDLSYTAAAKLGYVNTGNAEVDVELITRFDAPADGAVAAAPATGGEGRASGALVAAMAGAGASSAAGAAAPAPRESLTVETVVGGVAQPAGSSAGAVAAGAAQSVGASALRGAAPAVRGERLEVETVVAVPPTGPAPASPATTGPAATGPATTGPATTGPATTGPATPGPAATSSAATSPPTTSSAVAGRAMPPAAPASPPTVAASAPGAPGGFVAAAPAPSGAAAHPPAPPSAASGRAHYLQVAAFATRENAESSRMQLARELGWLADRLLVRQEGALFKVHAGPYRLRDEALAVADRIRQATTFRPFPVAR